MINPDTQIENIRERIWKSDEIADTDRKTPIEFSDELYLPRTKYSDHRHLRLLGHCINMAEKVSGLAGAIEDRDTAEEIVRWIDRTYNDIETNRDFRVVLRVSGRRVTDAEGGSGARGGPSSERSYGYPISPMEF